MESVEPSSCDEQDAIRVADRHCSDAEIALQLARLALAAEEEVAYERAETQPDTELDAIRTEIAELERSLAGSDGLDLSSLAAKFEVRDTRPARERASGADRAARVVELYRRAKSRFEKVIDEQVAGARARVQEARDALAAACARRASLVAKVAAEVAEAARRVAELARQERERREWIEQHEREQRDARQRQLARDAIRAFVQQRSISRVVHFTRLENIASIACSGVVPRADLERLGVHAITNDTIRLDGALDCSCLSIEWPNYKMFYKLQRATADARWAIVVLNPAVLWEYECFYCTQNAGHAAATREACNLGHSADSLRRLFEDASDHRVGSRKRADLNLPDSYPTNPQAEVLVRGVIDPSMIVAICVQCITDATALKGLPAERTDWHLKVLVLPALFSYRRDWASWKAQEAI